MSDAGSLRVENLAVAYGDALALDGVSLAVQAGDVTTIIGTNGAGKTTLIRAIAGLLPIRSGHIFYDGQEITGRPSHRICDLGLGQVAEGRQVFPSLSVRENLLMGPSFPARAAGPTKPMPPCWTSSPACASGCIRPPEPSRAANSRCWPSPAA
ncbi:ATP-binding cassette domain-containing protein [Elstera litoralis]|uniref:ATP-binding cassette domain-containing protein n=1 Tax=Elstera litoralis TaxID=552518 RepID=UPI000A44EE73